MTLMTIAVIALWLLLAEQLWHRSRRVASTDHTPHD